MRLLLYDLYDSVCWQRSVSHRSLVDRQSSALDSGSQKQWRSHHGWNHSSLLVFGCRNDTRSCHVVQMLSTNQKQEKSGHICFHTILQDVMSCFHGEFLCFRRICGKVWRMERLIWSLVITRLAQLTWNSWMTAEISWKLGAVFHPFNSVGFTWKNFMTIIFPVFQLMRRLVHIWKLVFIRRSVVVLVPRAKERIRPSLGLSTSLWKHVKACRSGGPKRFPQTGMRCWYRDLESRRNF